jgi:hypothetical protein
VIQQTKPTTKPNDEVKVSQRAAILFSEAYRKLAQDTDRMFAALLGIEWVAGILFAVIFSPRVWKGDQSSVSPHLIAAIFLGGAIAGIPIWLVLTQPGERLTRNAVAFAQMAFSGLLIHLTGGRIETHFHVFGSLAMLSFYRDREVLFTGTLTILVDHIARGLAYPTGDDLRPPPVSVRFRAPSRFRSVAVRRATQWSCDHIDGNHKNSSPCHS